MRLGESYPESGNGMKGGQYIESGSHDWGGRKPEVGAKRRLGSLLLMDFEGAVCWRRKWSAHRSMDRQIFCLRFLLFPISSEDSNYIYCSIKFHFMIFGCWIGLRAFIDSVLYLDCRLSFTRGRC